MLNSHTCCHSCLCVSGYWSSFHGTVRSVFVTKEAMDAKAEELKDWMRYVTLMKAPFLKGDLEEIVALDTKYPSPVDGFQVRWKRMHGLLKPIPHVLGGKRKRTRKGRRRHTRNATQSHRRV